MDQSTFFEQDEPEFRKPTSISRLDQLVAIRIDLTNISNNTKQVTYFELRKIRLDYRKCLDPSPSSKPERLEVKAINKLLKNLKTSHPEISSKQNFLLSQKNNDARNDTTGESSFNVTQQGDRSQNLMSSFVARAAAAAHKPREEEDEKTKAVKAMEDLQKLSETERYEVCMRWAIELQQKLAAEYVKPLSEESQVFLF